MAPFLRSMNKYPKSRFPLGHRPRNPIEELEMLGELTDSEEEYSDEDQESEEENEEGTEETGPAYAAPLPGVNRGIIIPNHVFQTRRASNDGGRKAVPIMLTNPNVFDCLVCYETLSIPVYQCINGHIVCSPCCSKISNKCPVCSTFIGNNRCRAIETVMESIKTMCSNANFGCTERMLYSKKREHEKTCTFVQYKCPMPTCKWFSTFNQLGHHLSHRHTYKIISFQYGKFFNVTMKRSKRFCVLQASSDGKLFLVTSHIGVCGNFVRLRHVGPDKLLPQQILYEVNLKSDGGVLLPPTSVETVNEGERLGFPQPSTTARHFHLPQEKFSLSGSLGVRFRITNESVATPSGEGPSSSRA